MFSILEASYIRLKISFGTISGAGTGKVKYYNPEYDNGVGGFSIGINITEANKDSEVTYNIHSDKTAHGKMDDQSDQNDLWTVEELNSYEFGIECDANLTAQIKNVYISIEGVIVTRNAFYQFPVRNPKDKAPRRRGYPGSESKYLQPAIVNEFDNVTVEVHGEKFETWARGDKVNSDILENSSIIEGILRSELGLSSQINTGSFDTAGMYSTADRYTWKLSGMVNSQKDSIDIIQDLCRHLGAIYFQDYQDKEKILVVKSRATIKTIDRTTIEQDQIKVSLTALNQVFNEFYINYRKNPLTNNFEKKRFVDASNTDLTSNSRGGTPNTYTGLCEDSQAKYNMVNRFEFDAEWIHFDDATAELLLKWFAEWFAYRKYIVEITTGGLDHLELELGDQVLIDHTLLPVGVTNSAHFMLIKNEHDLNGNKMKFKFIQIPNLLP